jgi:hypothetical protein
MIARMEHRLWLKDFLPKGIERKREILSIEPTISRAAPLSNNLYVAGGYKKSVTDYKWRKDSDENPDTIREIERKAKRVAPLWNKGATMYLSDEEDPTTIGKKV